MTPLAESIRPQKFSEICGQNEAVRYLEKIVLKKKPLSILLYGPPGSGKTTLARIYAKSFQLPFLNQTAVFNSVADLKKMLKAQEETPLFNKQTLLFVDEIHRFNRAQQDLFLPFLEDGSLILVCATTENPTFALNSALLSRLRLIKLEALDENSLLKILERFDFTPEEKEKLVKEASGDARALLNMAENLLAGLPTQKKLPLFGNDQHHDYMSRLHKTVRASDVTASLTWFNKMIEGGEEPLYIARRLIRMAVEDIGLADPQALPLAVAAHKAYSILGSPEGELALAEVVIYLALAPKSRAVNDAVKTSEYIPLEVGFEREMKKRVAYFRKLRESVYSSHADSESHSQE